jgi:hypothetical protein
MSRKAAKAQIRKDPSHEPHAIKLTEFKKQIGLGCVFCFLRLCVTSEWAVGLAKPFDLGCADIDESL